MATITSPLTVTPVHPAFAAEVSGAEDRLGAHIVDLSNTDADGKLMGWDDRRMLYQSGNQLWHSDSSFKPVPAHSSALSARVIPPEGGATEFASMRVAYETLPDELRL